VCLALAYTASHRDLLAQGVTTTLSDNDSEERERQSTSRKIGCRHALGRQARNETGLPKEMVLYCARHDYGTRVLMRTGNLAAVMKTMGHGDEKTAMHYQRPELEIVRSSALPWTAVRRLTLLKSGRSGKS
jgi:hypothetical protein